jgi:LacI family transcriptional regulator
MSAAGLESLIEMDAAEYAAADTAIMKHIKNGGVDAIFGLYNQSTIRAYEVLQNRHILVPDKVSLIGFDDFALAATLRPSITVVRQAIVELARTATHLLLAHMSGETTSPQQIEIASDLVIRHSCGCRPD